VKLSPSWVERLKRHGFEAVHWSTIGSATAPDVEILAWANEHQFVVITNDLDFSGILAASAGATSSVVQIRTQDLLSDDAVSAVASALEVHREDIERGALLSIDEGGTCEGCCCLSRARRVVRSAIPLSLCTPSSHSPGCGLLDFDRRKIGGTQTRERCSHLWARGSPLKIAAA
jgi:predicted nuclease of predicted toxin-antitoxin system